MTPIAAFTLQQNYRIKHNLNLVVNVNEVGEFYPVVQYIDKPQESEGNVVSFQDYKKALENGLEICKKIVDDRKRKIN